MNQCGNSDQKYLNLAIAYFLRNTMVLPIVSSFPTGKPNQLIICKDLEMAKVSSIEKNNRRIALATRHEPIRRELRAKVKNPHLPDEERRAAQLKLQAMPRDGALIRVRHRCGVTGRARGNYRKFGISRIVFREAANAGHIPGVVKSSW